MQPKQKKLGTEWPLPEELMTEILLRLPVKSLLRFKLVCKPLNSLISDTHFVKLHLRRCSASNANPLVIFFPPCDFDDDISSLRIKSFLKPPPSTITNELHRLRSSWNDPYLPIGSCNGLVCLIGTHYSNHDQHFFWVCFWNPTTRSTSQKSFTLPIMSEHVNMSGQVHSYLYVNCGFGYDYMSNAYKVLFIEKNQDVLVFNMGDNNWRHVGCFPSDLTTLVGRDRIGVHFNGTLNWLVIRKIYENDFHCEINKYNIKWDNGSCMILSFDFDKEEFVRLMLPAMPHKFSDPHLGVLCEHLCVSHKDERNNFVIWQMKEFGVDVSWTKLLSINHDKDLLPHNLPLPFGFPLYMFDNGDVLMLPEMFLYNHRDNRVDPLEIPTNIFASSAVICSESMISPH
ncbi:F-box/kelch-repeat protein At3g23880-like [Lotus japonicus]|uniref:F-box/kelch-repeat protein At3g23880-like n=1 Tax=Lotus japonicus TaxID=34305 RepID=UPI00258C65AB|nr:F-box/kelch-repeat protein At3g23880-like [Lotus japonicus]